MNCSSKPCFSNLFLGYSASKQEVQGFAHSCPKFYSANVNPINKLRVLSAYTNEEPTSTRSSFLQNGIHRVQLITSLLAGTFALLGPRLIARADETASPALSTPTAPAVTTVEPVPLGPPPTDFGLIENDYYGDAQKVSKPKLSTKGNHPFTQIFASKSSTFYSC